MLSKVNRMAVASDRNTRFRDGDLIKGELAADQMLFLQHPRVHY